MHGERKIYVYLKVLDPGGLQTDYSFVDRVTG